ncbi:S9 family peptidase [Pseudoalteromonas sp. C2R02]|uniref:alpha/beta hydrolase family protein n=1 Tax=Pseudoalteromonas sp. C2R02 TaxID=2841565 RepID=UPI001C07F44F|nr:S9 family peptidase [Pseudoalteromonas sp. C2R02]MBU2972506.1 S9 family peptidase [Pseudoalteromonas sp. C2R02]
MFKHVSVLSTLAISLLLPFQSVSAEQANNKLVNYDDIFNIEYAASPQVSPNGDYVIYERRAMDIMTDSSRVNLWQVNIDGTQHEPVFSGKASYRMPRFSPDGKQLAYLSSYEGDNQLYILWLESGKTSRVTNLQSAPSDISWSPDGKTIAFSMFKPGKSTSLFKEMPKKPKGANWAGTAKYIDQMNYRRDGAGFNKPGFRHIYVVPALGGTARQVTSGDYHHGGVINWSIDSKNIIIDGDRHDDWQDRPIESDIYQVNVNTGNITTLVKRDGPDNRPLISPNGKKIAYLSFEDKKLSSQNTQLYVMDTNGKNAKNLTPDLDRSVSNVHWAQNGKGLYFSYDDHGQSYVGYVDLKGKLKRKVVATGGQSLGRPYTSGDFTVADNRSLVFTIADNQRPADLAVINKKGKITQLTQLNEDVFGHKTLAKVEALTVKSSVDNRDIEAWIALPPGFDATKKYPMILEIHGGPHAAYGPNYSTEIQLMAAKGYVVVWANPRGSTSYGAEFANTIHHNYPSEDYNDLMDVVDGVIGKGYVDEKQLFVTGGSGGGTLTAWIVGKTNRFKAAVVAKPVINWMSFSLTADGYSYFTKYWMPGMPWDHADHLWNHSPLSLVGNVKTPTMLLTGEVDYRTPMSETEQYYQALKLQNVDAAMVRIPKAAHGIAARPSNLIQKVGNILAWFEKYKTAEK